MVHMVIAAAYDAVLEAAAIPAHVLTQPMQELSFCFDTGGYFLMQSPMW